MNPNNTHNTNPNSRLSTLTEQQQEQLRRQRLNHKIDQQIAELADARDYNLLACRTKAQEDKVWRIFNSAEQELRSRRAR